jgi:hypothetical protein
MTPRSLMRPVLALFLMAMSTAWIARAQVTSGPDCSAAPYNVPTGFPSSATTALQDQAHMMCLQGLQFPGPTSNPAVSTTLVGDPYAPMNAFPTSLTAPNTNNWTDVPGYVVVRWQWGQWATYDLPQSNGQANVLCGGTTMGAPGCTETLEYGTSVGGATNGYGDYGPVEQTSGGYPIPGARPYPTGSASYAFPNNSGPCTTPSCTAAGFYTPIDIFTMKDGVTKITSPEDWWLKRRPEILDLVQKEIYGYQIPQSEWPVIKWTIGAVTTGTQAGTIACITPTTGTACPNGTVADGNTYAYRQKTYTATFSNSNYPAGAPPLRNQPTLSITCRFPANATGKVPVFLGNSESDTDFQYTAPAGFGACGFTQSSLQADAGGASATSYLSGLINGSNWRQPTDAGTLQIWAWGTSRLIDEFANDPDPIGPDPDKVAVIGVSRDGKLALVQAAMDQRIVATLPSDAGEGGTSFLRRNMGESIESIVGDGEYYWMAGNLMNYAGPRCSTNPNRGPMGCQPAYMPRAVEDLDVDSPEVEALVAPRALMTNGGLTGDSWEDARGMYISAAIAGPVWQLLGWPGQVIPPGTAFTSNPTNYNTNSESIGGTPPANVAFISGTVGYRRHSQGHTDVPEWPWFVTFASKYLNDVRPVIAAGQSFNLPATDSNVGQVQGTPGGGGSLSNWQIKGGNGAYVFSIDPNTGWITIPDRTKLNGSSSWTLTLMASDGILPSHDAVVTINTANVAGNVQLVTTTSISLNNDGSYIDAITITNNGTGTAQNVVLNGVTLGGVSGTPTPQPLISIAPGGVAVTSVTVPSSAGTPGSRVIQQVSGTYTGGTFGGSLRAVLPSNP